MIAKESSIVGQDRREVQVAQLHIEQRRLVHTASLDDLSGFVDTQIDNRRWNLGRDRQPPCIQLCCRRRKKLSSMKPSTPSTPPFSFPLAGAANSTWRASAPRNAENASFSSRFLPRKTRVTAVFALSKAAERFKTTEQAGEERRLVAVPRCFRRKVGAIA